MSDYVKQKIDELVEKFGPVPDSWKFGDGLNWSSPFEEVRLHVELPYWLMMSNGDVTVTWSGQDFHLAIHQERMEMFANFFTDSRQTRVLEAPLNRRLIMEPQKLLNYSVEKNQPFFLRASRTVIGLKVWALSDAFRERNEADRPGFQREQETYWASLCEAHIPVVNELIQRYRLLTYDYFPYELSAWDVPVWSLQKEDRQFTALLMPYKGWDFRPVIVGDGKTSGGEPSLSQFEWTSSVDIESVSSSNASPGEFDLLDARSLMERGDFTGAVRRTVTAIEVLVAEKLLLELQKKYPQATAEEKFKKTEKNFPGRFRQWIKLSKATIPEPMFASFIDTRDIRHRIVHRGLRLTSNDRGRAQRAVDTGRWLYNRIEDRPDRVKVRETGALKSAGRVAIAVRFPSEIGANGITIGPLDA